MSTKTSQNSLVFSTTLFSNGIYQGFLSNHQRNGLGLYLWDSGDLYFGQWQHDEIHGEGYFFKENGCFLHAFFEKSQANGLGVLKTRDNCVVLGFWKDGALDDRAIKYFFKENQWFLCDFAAGKFVKCEKTGKDFPNDGFPQGKSQAFRKELSDFAEILEENNKKLKENRGLEEREFVYRNFDDGGVFMGITQGNVPHGLGIFKFPDDKMHLGLYQNGVLEGPCFINFHNGDFFCGEIKRQKFENFAINYQKSRDSWLQCEFRNGVQTRILKKINDPSNEIPALGRSIFKKYFKEISKKSTGKSLFSEPVFPAFEELLDFQAKDWGLSPIKTKKPEEKGLTDRKINIYEIILNENDGLATKMSTKTQDSQHFFSENSQREMLEDPKELSINKEMHVPPLFEEVKRKESVFSKKSQRKNEEINGENDDFQGNPKKKPWKSTIKMKKNVDFPNKIKEMMENVTGKVAEVEEKMKKNAENLGKTDKKPNNSSDFPSNPVYLDILEGKKREKADNSAKKSENTAKLEEIAVSHGKDGKKIDFCEKEIATEKKKAKFEENAEETSEKPDIFKENGEKTQVLTENAKESCISLGKVEEIIKDIDLKWENWKRNREITGNIEQTTEKTRVNFSTNEIHEYYDSLEKCYRDLGVNKGELLDLILKRFKQELDRKFPQFANLPGFLYQKFEIPVVSAENPKNIRAVMPLFVRIPLKNN